MRLYKSLYENIDDKWRYRSGLRASQKNFHRLKENHMIYPSVVSIETYAACNASCEFCPSSALQRKGTVMSVKVFEKIIDDLTAIPGKIPFTINLSRVNEPFLDKRIFAFSEHINRLLPNCSLIFFSNGSLLDKKKMEKLMKIKRIKSLRISFNDHRKKHYEQIMNISYENTLQNLMLIHKMKQSGELDFQINLSRVAGDSRIDTEFIKWVEGRFPCFNVTVKPRFSWLSSDDGSESGAPKVGCKQWFKLHFLANGKNAFCCIDSEGNFGSGDVINSNALDIYNQDRYLNVRRKIKNRLELESCAKCSLGVPGNRGSFTHGKRG